MLSFLKRSCMPGLIALVYLQYLSTYWRKTIIPPEALLKLAARSLRQRLSLPLRRKTSRMMLSICNRHPPLTVPPFTGPRPGFFTRWGKAYVADWSGNAPGTDPSLVSKRRGTPAPISSPPFPATDWPIGGTILIGAPDTQTYPLMQAVNENKSRAKWYGWVSVGANGSTNNRSNASKGIPSNFPSALR